MHSNVILPATKKKGKKSTTASLTTSSRISTQDIKDIVKRLLHQQHRNSTRKNYYTIWKVFSDFFIRLDDKPANWEDRLTLFVGFLIENKRQSSTVKSYISAIKSVLREDNIKLDEDTYLLSSLTKACKLQNDQICTRLPIQKGMLGLILRQIDAHYRDALQPQPYLAILFKTLFSTMYYGLLRVSEVSSGGHPVLARDVHIRGNKKKFMMILRTSKTHWKNMKPQIIKISASKSIVGDKFKKDSTTTMDNTSCPYQLLRDFASIRGGYVEDSEPFFMFSDRSHISPQQVNTCLKMVVKETGSDDTLYSGHSMRIGRTSGLYKLGLSVETIKKLGQWQSNAVFKYLRT